VNNDDGERDVVGVADDVMTFAATTAWFGVLTDHILLSLGLLVFVCSILLLYISSLSSLPPPSSYHPSPAHNNAASA